MKKIFEWGTGEFAKKVFDTLDHNKCEFLGFLDKNKEKTGTFWEGKYKIYNLDIIKETSCDYIVVSVKNLVNTIIADAKKIGIEREKLILFFEDDLSEFDFFNEDKIRILGLEAENQKLKLMIDNLPYELGDDIPKVMTAEETIKIIINEKKSIARFGDGEFEMMRGESRPWFQEPLRSLEGKLKEAFFSNTDTVITAISDCFGSLMEYTEIAAHNMRLYLNREIRKSIYEFLDMKRIYGNAYITRPYLFYKNDDNANRIFPLFKELFRDKNLIIVEGKYSRLGVGNDLFDTASSIRRIICPEKNAFSRYDDIKEAIKKYVKQDDLVLVSLGPTATVLAYELGNEEIWTVDIGQIDTEYEHYLRGTKDKIEIPGKSVAELPWWHEPDEIRNEKYESEIVEIIE